MKRSVLAAGMCGDGDDGRAAACCELCGAEAAVHCEADAAFLCAGCDAKVHGANFLASRHRRRRVTPAAAGVGELGGCDGDESGTSSASSSCMSTADSGTTPAAATRGQKHRQQPRGWKRSTNPKRRARGEVVLEGWAKRMGLAARAARRRAAAAGHALRACGRDVAMARVPLRVAMAAALWLEVAAHSAGAGQADSLQRLEACAHVPARLVLAVASSMGRARARWQAAVHGEEGWDECS